MYIDMSYSIRELDQLNRTSQRVPGHLTMVAQLSEEQQRSIVSLLVTNTVYYMC